MKSYLFLIVSGHPELDNNIVFTFDTFEDTKQNTYLDATVYELRLLLSP